MTTRTETKETTRDGFDLVMVRERDGWMCSLYRTGKQVPLHRTLVADEAKAEAWFATKIAKEVK